MKITSSKRPTFYRSVYFDFYASIIVLYVQFFQSKERLITNLKSSQSTDGSSNNVHEIIIEEVKTENYRLQSQLQTSEQLVLSLRTELQVQ